MLKVSMMQVRAKLGELVDRVRMRDEAFELVREHGRARRRGGAGLVVAVLISPERFERLQRAAAELERQRSE